MNSVLWQKASGDIGSPGLDDLWSFRICDVAGMHEVATDVAANIRGTDREVHCALLLQSAQSILLPEISFKLAQTWLSSRLNGTAGGDIRPLSVL
jgi:hypothetical protein